MDRNEREEVIRALCLQGQHNRAIEETLGLYEPELRRFIASLVRDRDRADECFALFQVRLLLGLPRFQWRSSLRTWLFRVARNTCYEALQAPSYEVLVSQLPSGPAQPERSHTRPWLRSDVKERFRALRERLDPRDRILLQLRVDQRRSWVEVARLLVEPEEAEPSPEELRRRAVVLRQQFQRLKERLHALAREAGLLSEGDSGHEAGAAL